MTPLWVCRSHIKSIGPGDAPWTDFVLSHDLLYLCRNGCLYLFSRLSLTGLPAAVTIAMV